MTAGRWLRAARRDRRQSQRELAALANTSLSTIARIEAGKMVPRLDTFVLLLAALGFELVIVDRHGRLLTLEEDHDRLRDRAGRRFPAHLVAGKVPSYWDREGRTWWGWERIAWPFGPGTPPEHTFWRRRELEPIPPWAVDRPRERGYLWDDAT